MHQMLHLVLAFLSPLAASCGIYLPGTNLTLNRHTLHDGAARHTRDTGLPDNVQPQVVFEILGLH